MCGIVGFASTEGMLNRSQRMQFLRMGLDINSWRGWESTGIALVTQGSIDPPLVYKRALNGRDFIQLHQVEKYLNDIEKYSVVLGHNRAATTGRGNIVDFNAHPFQYGKITLVHNGHIKNCHDLKGATNGAHCQVDSAQVAFSMDANGEIETLEQVEGGFVFVWWNSETGLLNIARNTERPLHMAFIEKENTFFWASEFTQLLHLLKDVKIDEDIGVLYPEAWNWYQFNLKNLREFTKKPFTKSQGRRSHQSSFGGRGIGYNNIWQGGWTDEEIEAWEREEEDIHTARVARNAENNTTKTIKRNLNNIQQDISNKRLQEIKRSGVPTTDRRLNRAKMELKKLGLEYGVLKNCTPDTWVRYKNQRSLGSVIARSQSDGHVVEIQQIQHEDYLKYARFGHILVNYVNVRNGPNNDRRIVGVVATEMQHCLDRWEEKLKNNQQNSISREYNGPNGRKITLARFNELVKLGCANCQTDIDPKDHEKIVWVGSADHPICEECSSDPKIMELLGFPDHFKQIAVH